MSFLKTFVTRRQSILTIAWGASILGATTKAESNPAISKLTTWLTLPPTPSLPSASKTGMANVDGVPIFFAQFGQGPHVLLLHGGLANSNYWGNQIRELARNFSVTVMDTRGHGRSPLISTTFSYDLFAKDVIGLLDYLHIPTTAIIGWSDGAITGIQLAMKYPQRLSGLFAFGANVTPDGLKVGGSKAGAFASFTSRSRLEYRSLSPRPDSWPQLVRGLGVMWRTEPNLTKAQLAKIRLPVTIAEGQYDEIIKTQHTEQIANEILNARLSILTNVSHFAMLQNPEQFNEAINSFLSDKG